MADESKKATLESNSPDNLFRTPAGCAVAAVRVLGYFNVVGQIVRRDSEEGFIGGRQRAAEWGDGFSSGRGEFAKPYDAAPWQIKFQRFGQA